MSRFARLLAIMLLSLTAVTGTAKEVKYVILIIGDGFGYNQRILVESLIGEKLAMSQLPVFVRNNTNNITGTTTDSAASGTAIACGIKTTNGRIGMTADQKPVESLAGRLKQVKHFQIGMISSSPLNDATPAAHYAHTSSRGATDEISAQIATFGVDYLSGEKLKGNYREAMKNLAKAGYTVADDDSLLAPEAKVVCPVFIYSKPWTPGWNGAKSGSTLAEHTAKALQVLSQNPDGFFLMVENGHTDYAGHANDAGKLVREVKALDEVIKVALKFQSEHADETLIVFTADHETGGLNIDNMKPDKLPLLLQQRRELGEIQADLGKQIKDKTIASNAQLIEFLQSELGLDDEPFTEAEIASIIKDSNDKAKRHRSMYGDYNNALAAAASCRDVRIGIKYTTHGHSSARVVTNAAGVEADKFAAIKENSDIPHVIKDLVLGNSEPDLNLELVRGAQLERRYCGDKATLPINLECEVIGPKITQKVKGKTFVQPRLASRITVSPVYHSGMHTYAVKITNTSQAEPVTFALHNFPQPGRGFMDNPPKFYLYDLLAGTCYGQVAKLPTLTLPPNTAMVLLASLSPLPDLTAAPVALKANFTPAVYPVAKLTEPLQIDGKLDEACYKNLTLGKFVNLQGLQPDEPTECALFCYGEGESQILYVAAIVHDRKLVNKVKSHDGPLWSDDCLDMHFSGANNDVIQFIVNASGVFYDAHNQNSKWESDGVQIATSLLPDHEGWILEMALPLRNLRVEQPLIGNLCRQHQPKHSLSALFTPGSSLHDRGYWGELQFPAK